MKRLDSRLGVGLSSLLLGDDLSSDDELSDVVLLGEVEELSDLGGPLGSEPLGEGLGGESLDLLLSLLDDDDREDGDVVSDDASSDRLSLPLSGSSGSVARVAVGEEELDSVREQDTLLHRESLLVVSTSDSEDVSLPLVTDAENDGGSGRAIARGEVEGQVWAAGGVRREDMGAR